MSDGVMIALIGIAGTLITAAGAAIWQIVTLILKTYKDQAKATVSVTGKENDHLRDEVDSKLSLILSEVRAVREEQAEVRQDLWNFRREDR